MTGTRVTPPLRGTSGATVLRALGSRVLRLGLQLPFSLLILPLVVHHVPVGVYGAWAGLASAVTLASLADVGVRTELTRRVAQHWGRADVRGVERELARCLTVSTSTAIALGAVALAATPKIVSLVLPHPPVGLDHGQAELLFMGLVVLAVVALVTQTFAAVLQGVQRGDRENLAWTAGLGTYVVVLVSGLLAGLTWQALLLASAASTLVGMTVILRSIATILPEVRVRWGPVSLGETRVLLTASGILVVTQLSDVIDTQVDKLLLVRYTAPAHAAWYDVGASVVGGLRSFALIGLVVLLPGLAELFVRRPDGAVRLYERVAALTIPWAFVILGGGAVLGPPFVHLWLGSSYSAAGTVIRMLSIAMLIQAVAAPGAMLAVAIGHARRAAVAAGVNIAVNASVSLVLVQHIGLQGALIGSIAGNACATALFLLLLRPVAPSLCFAGLRPGTLLLGTTAVAVGCWIVQGHSWQAFVLGGVGWAVVSASLLLRGEAAPRNLLAQLRERGSSTADA